MNILMIVALILAVPVILIPVVFVWYINIAGLLEVKKAQAKVKKEAKEKATVAQW